MKWLIVPCPHGRGAVPNLYKNDDGLLAVYIVSETIEVSTQRHCQRLDMTQDISWLRLGKAISVRSKKIYNEQKKYGGIAFVRRLLQKFKTVWQSQHPASLTVAVVAEVNGLMMCGLPSSHPPGHPTTPWPPAATSPTPLVSLPTSLRNWDLTPTGSSCFRGRLFLNCLPGRTILYRTTF